MGLLYVATLVLKACTTILISASIHIFFQSIGAAFPYPLMRGITGAPASLREKVKATMPPFLSVYMVYVVIGTFILIVSSIPMAASLPIQVERFDLVIVGLLVISLIRVLSLVLSTELFRSLSVWVVATFGMLFFFSFHKREEIANLGIAIFLDPTTGQSSYSLIYYIPLLAFVFALLAELAWLGYVTVKKGLSVPVAFIEKMRQSTTTVEIGYGRSRIEDTYLNTAREVIAVDGLYEVCWVSLGGTEEFYRELIAVLAARQALDGRATVRFDDYYDLDDSQQKIFRTKAKKLLKDRGMFLLPARAHAERRRFESILGFPPGIINDVGDERFMIVNREVLVISWAAYTAGRTSERPRSTMCCRTRNFSRIDTYRRRFGAMWGHYQLNRLRPILSRLPKSSLKLLEMVIERSGNWTLPLLVEEAKRRSIAELADVSKAKDALEDLVHNDLIIVTGEFLQRDGRSFVWQDRLLKDFL